MRVIAYARFSTDLQDGRSIEDQQRVCEELVAREVPGVAPVRHFFDAGLSGASMIGRSGLQALLRAVRAGEVDLLVTEHTDRLSRRLADLAAIFDQCRFAGVRLVTMAQGEIDETKIAFMGLMAQQFLKDLAQKTHRGLRGQVERGRSAGGLCYGYRVPAVGAQVVDVEQAAVVVRIFTEFAAGVSPKAIAKRLNSEGVPSPSGSGWSPSTIHGHAGRGTGLLNNTLYIGRRVWNRQRFIKDPSTGKRVARLNPPSAWIEKDVPELRIVDDALWQAAKARQEAARRATRGGIVQARRPVHLFSGLTKCAECGGGFTLSSRDTLRCFNQVARGTCTNRRTVTRQELEARMLRALRERFFEPGVFAAFCRTFTEEVNRLRREQRAALATAPREIASLNRRSKEIMELLLQGFRTEAWKAELQQIDRRWAELEALMAKNEIPPPALHPQMAEVFRQKTEQLAAALDHQETPTREAARQALRGLIERIDIPAEDELFQVRGNLGEMLAAASGAASGAEIVDYVGCGGGI